MMEKEVVLSALKPLILMQINANHAVMAVKYVMTREHAHNVKNQPYFKTVNAIFVKKEPILSLKIASYAEKTVCNAIASNNVLFARNQP